MLKMMNVGRESSVIACYFKNAHDFGVNAQLFLSSEYEFSHEAYFPGDRKRLTKQQAYCVYGPIYYLCFSFLIGHILNDGIFYHAVFNKYLEIFKG